MCGSRLNLVAEGYPRLVATFKDADRIRTGPAAVDGVPQVFIAGAVPRLRGRNCRRLTN